MDWNDLRYVLAVARNKTLLEAAAKLGVAHTTVGRRLKSLEDQLGVLLFDRTPEGFIPTAAGADLAEVAERMETEVLSVEGRVLGRDAQLRGALRISTADAIFYRFEDVFTSFTERFPNIDLTLGMSSTPVSLTRREADVAIRLSNSPPEYLVGRKLGYVQFAIYGSGALIERIGEGAPLNAFPWLGWDGGPNHQWFNEWLQHNAPNAKIVLRLDDRSLLMAHAVRSGIGVQILPCFLADPDPQLHRIAPLDEIFRLDLWLLTLPELRLNSRVRAFMDHFKDALDQHRNLLAGSE